MNKDTSSGVIPAAPWPCERCPTLEAACPCELAEKWAEDMRRQVSDLQHARTCRECGDLADGDQGLCSTCADTLETVVREKDAELAAMREAAALGSDGWRLVFDLSMTDEDCDNAEAMEAKIQAALSLPHAKAAYEHVSTLERFAQAALKMHAAREAVHVATSDPEPSVYNAALQASRAADRAYGEALAALRGEVGR